jgi:hypothetical protein
VLKRLSSHPARDLIGLYSFPIIFFVAPLLALVIFSGIMAWSPDATLQIDSWFIVSIVALLVFGQVFERHINKYEVMENQIRFLLFRCIPIARIEIADIQGIARCSSWEIWKLYRARWVNRLWGNCVMIRRAHGLTKTLVITPDSPSEFIQQIEEAKRKLIEAEKPRP